MTSPFGGVSGDTAWWTVRSPCPPNQPVWFSLNTALSSHMTRAPFSVQLSSRDADSVARDPSI